MSDDIVQRLRSIKIVHQGVVDMTIWEAALEIERLRTLARALYADARACPTNHDVSATNAWELYEEALNV